MSRGLRNLFQPPALPAAPWARIRRVEMGKNVPEDARRMCAQDQEIERAFKEETRALQRSYYARNKDKIAALQRSYYARNKDKWRTVYAANRRRRLRQQRAAA